MNAAAKLRALHPLRCQCECAICEAAEELERTTDRIRKARLVWAMACSCGECEACDTLFSELQRICRDAPEAAVESPSDNS